MGTGLVAVGDVEQEGAEDHEHEAGQAEPPKPFAAEAKEEGGVFLTGCKSCADDAADVSSGKRDGTSASLFSPASRQIPVSSLPPMPMQSATILGQVSPPPATKAGENAWQERGERVKEAATPGVGIRVSRERLLPLWLTGGFFAIGLFTFAVIPLVFWWARRPLGEGIFAHHSVVLLAHLFALGWGTAVALGAWPQLATVALQSAGSLRPGLVKGSLAAYLLGLPLMLFAMARGEYAWVAVGGGAVATAVLLSLLTSLPGIRRGERNSVMLAFAAPAFLSLFLVALVGVVLAINRVTGWLGPSWYQTIAAHLYLGPVGWFGLLIPGVSYELAPFFGLTKTRGEPGRGRRHRLVAIILATGLLGGLISALFGAFHPVWLGVTASGYLIFLVDLKAVYGKRPFERRTATLTGVRAAHAHLLLLALWLAWESLMQAGLAGPGYATASALRRWTLFGWFAAAGWLSNSIVSVPPSDPPLFDLAQPVLGEAERGDQDGISPHGRSELGPGGALGVQRRGGRRRTWVVVSSRCGARAQCDRVRCGHVDPRLQSREGVFQVIRIDWRSR